MSQPEMAAKRYKKYHSKVRTGCTTCRRRRIKCDETHPLCARCTRAGFECSYNAPKDTPSAQTTVLQLSSHDSAKLDLQNTRPVISCRRLSHDGHVVVKSSCDVRHIDRLYQACEICEKRSVETQPGQPRKTSTGFGDLVEQASSATFDNKEPNYASQNQTSCGTRYTSPGLWSLDSMESSAIQFFHEKTKKSLKALNSAAVVFFDLIIPRLFFSEPAIKEQLITLGLVHQAQLCQRRSNFSLNLQAQTRYGMALKSVSQQIANAGIHVTLSSCLLFIAIEMLQERRDIANKHLKAGLKLLGLQQTAPPSTHQMIENVMHPVFTHLVANASRSWESDVKITPSMRWSRPVVSDRYTSCTEAWEKYFEICVNRPPPNLIPETPYISPFRDGTWQIMRDRVCALEHELAGPPRTTLQLRLLKAYYSLISIASKCNEAPDEMAWDGYLSQFERMLDLADEICHSPDTYNFDAEDEPDFDVSPGVWALLSLIGMSCRDPLTRRRAQKLLNVHHKRCGHHDEDVQAQHLSVIIAWEEGSREVKSYRDVPTEARVRFLGCDYTNLPEVKISISKWPYTEVETIIRHAEGGKKSAFKILPTYPAEEAARNIGFQGLMRPKARQCLCKALGIT